MDVEILLFPVQTKKFWNFVEWLLSVVCFCLILLVFIKIKINKYCFNISSRQKYYLKRLRWKNRCSQPVRKSIAMRYRTHLHKTHFQEHLQAVLMLHCVYNTSNAAKRRKKAMCTHCIFYKTNLNLHELLLLTKRIENVFFILSASAFIYKKKVFFTFFTCFHSEVRMNYLLIWY